MKKTLSLSALALLNSAIFAQEIDVCDYDSISEEGAVPTLSVKSLGESFGKPDNLYEPSPESALATNEISVPVNGYSGKGEISIPLFTIECGDYSLPISISYHTGGIKVSNESSRIGLGWSLNAGGIISRSVIGEDDLTSLKGYSRFYDSSLPKGRILYSVDEPDIFSYGFASYSSRFYYMREYEEHTGSPLLGNLDTLRIEPVFFSATPEDNLQIDYDSISQSFCIMTPELTKFYFRDREVVKKKKIIGEKNGFALMIDSVDVRGDSILMGPLMQQDYMPTFSGSVPVTTSWYLSEIRFVNGDSILFEYDTLTDSYISPCRKDEVLYKATEERNSSYVLPTISILSWELTSQSPVLRRITWKNGSIAFIPRETPRTDLRSGTSGDLAYGLASIQVTSSLGESVCHYQFHQSYFEGEGGDTASYLLRRLRLDSISVLGRQGGRMSYSFSYDTSDNLPAKNYPYTDRWGYYTGEKKDKIPYDTADSKQFFSSLKSDVYDNAVSDMEPFPVSTAKASTWALTSVRNPLGKETQIQYACHVVDHPRRAIPKDTTSILLYKNYAINEIDTVLVLPGKGTLLAEYEYHPLPLLDPSTPPYPYLEDDNPVNYPQAESRTQIFDINMDRNHHFTSTGFPTYMREYSGEGPDYFFFHASREYNCRDTLRVKLRTSERADAYLLLRIVRTTSHIPGGGVCISEIQTENKGNSYLYAYGLPLRDPVYCAKTYYYRPNGQRINMVEYHSQPLMQVGDFYATADVGYSQVAVRWFASGDTLKTDSLFFHNTIAPRYPQMLSSRADPMNGKLSRKVSLSASFVQNESDYEYCQVRKETIHVMDGEKSKNNLRRVAAFFVAPSHIKETKHLYSPSGHPSSQHTDISMAYQPHLLLPSTISFMVDSTMSYSTRKIYSHSSDRFPVWRECGRKCLPIEEDRFVNGRLSQQIIHFYTPDSMAYPSEDYSFYNLPGENLPQPLELTPPGEPAGWDYTPDVCYTSYDSKGRCTSYCTRMGQNTVQLWGYRHQYLIAEIKNATLEEVISQGVDVEAIADKAAPSAADWTLLKSLRTRLPQSAVTICQYRPLIGLSNVLDPSGFERRYSYDGFNRLQRESIVDGGVEHIIKEYQHHYATEE